MNRDSLTMLAPIFVLCLGVSAIGWYYFFVPRIPPEQQESYALKLELLNHLTPGMTRQEVDPFLTNVTTRYQCDFDTWTLDILLFHETLDLAAPLYLKYEIKGEGEVLTGIHGIESYDIESDIKLCDRVR